MTHRPTEGNQTALLHWYRQFNGSSKAREIALVPKMWELGYVGHPIDLKNEFNRLITSNESPKGE